MKSDNNQKYTWCSDKLPPKIDHHSVIKHRIVNDYLENYVKTLMSNVIIPKLKLTIVDGFAGGGQYRDANNSFVPGSPIVILQAIKAARSIINRELDKPREVEVDYYFNDINKDNIDYLRTIIKEYSLAGEIDMVDIPRISYSIEDFKIFAPKIINHFKSHYQNRRFIFILDQYNYNNVSFSIVKEIFLCLPKSEVILTFNVGSLETFLSDGPPSRKPMQEIGLESYIPWNDLKELRSTEKDRKHLRAISQSSLANGIRLESRAEYMTPFFVRPNNNNPWDYWLIHLSNHFKAHDVMKKLHWMHGNRFGHQLSPGYFSYGYSAKDGLLYNGSGLFEFDNRNICVEGIVEYIDRIQGYKIGG